MNHDGPHLSFPFRVGPSGRTVTTQSSDEHLRDEVLQLILTNPGERLFQPDFGGGVRRMVFGTDDNYGSVTRALLTQSLTRWLGTRLTLEALEVAHIESRLEVTLTYRSHGSSESRTLTFAGAAP